MKLCRLILQSPLIEELDVEILEDLEKEIPLSSDDLIENINQLYIQQLELETNVAYLLNKYRSKFVRVSTEKDRKWAYLSARTSSRDPKNKLDPGYTDLLDSSNEYENLVDSLQLLFKIVFNRKTKLQELSWNYRKEIELAR